MKRDNTPFLCLAAGGICCIVLALLGYAGSPVLPGLLWALFCLLAISLGGLAILSLWQLTGGRWGQALGPVLRCVLPPLPLLALIFLVFLFQLPALYSWAGAAPQPEVVLKKAGYLNPAFFIVRAVVYWALWCGWAAFMTRRENTPGSGTAGASIGLMVFFLTLSFAAIDWVMSLEPAWYSTMYGLLYVAEFGFAALAFSVTVLAWNSWRGRTELLADRSVRSDLGNLELAFLLLWGYASVSQFLVTWMGNLPEEVSWYIVRNSGGWKAATVTIALLHALCFLALLSPRVKTNLVTLGTVSAVLLLARVIDLYWLILPARQPHPLPSAASLVALLAVALLWGGVFLSSFRKVVVPALIALVLAAALPHPVCAQQEDQVAQKAGVDEHLGKQLNMTRTFTGRDGRPVKLSELFERGKPVILTPVYYRCPELCPAIMRGLVDMVNQLRLSLGEDYLLVMVSIDPSETPEDATRAFITYTPMLHDPLKAKNGWFFLSGSADQITGLMDELGFRYQRETKTYVHAALSAIVSPSGKISRYHYGISFPAGDIRLGMVEASEGKIGSTLDKVLLYCFHYDAATGRYTPMVMNIVRAAGLGMLLLLLLGWWLMRGRPRTQET